MVRLGWADHLSAAFHADLPLERSPVHDHGGIVMLLQLFALARGGVRVESESFAAVALQPSISKNCSACTPLLCQVVLDLHSLYMTFSEHNLQQDHACGWLRVGIHSCQAPERNHRALSGRERGSQTQCAEAQKAVVTAYIAVGSTVRPTASLNQRSNSSKGSEPTSASSRGGFLS